MPMLPFSRLLVVAPHPDDETLGAGGTLHRCATEGIETAVLCCIVPGADRSPELELACKTLRVGRLDVMEHTAPERMPGRQFLDRLPHELLIDRIDDHIQAVQPDAIMLPPAWAHHQEHRAVAAATITALRPNAGTNKGAVPLVLTYEHGADWWGLEPAPQPTFFVQLGLGDVNAKAQALEAHASQVRDMPSERCRDSVFALARMRGMQAGCDLAEGFSVRRFIL